MCPDIFFVALGSANVKELAVMCVDIFQLLRTFPLSLYQAIVLQTLSKLVKGP